MTSRIYTCLAFVVLITMANARPQKFEDVFDKQNVNMLKDYVHQTGGISEGKTFEKQRNKDNLSDLHHLVFNDRTKALYNEMQRHAYWKSPVHIRTQWEGEKKFDEPKEPSQTAVRNTININTYHSKKANLDLIMDSTFVQKGDKMEPVDPMLGLNFQMKY